MKDTSSLGSGVLCGHMANSGGPALARGATYRVVLLGELGVGKTSLFRRIKDNTFDQQQPATSGIDSCSKYITVDGEEVVVSFWACAACMVVAAFIVGCS